MWCLGLRLQATNVVMKNAVPRGQKALKEVLNLRKENRISFLQLYKESHTPPK